MTDTLLLFECLELIDELIVDPEIDFGPAYSMAVRRRELLLEKLRKRLQQA